MCKDAPHGPVLSRRSRSPRVSRAPIRGTRRVVDQGRTHGRDRRRPRAGPAARVGGRAGVRLPRRRHQRPDRRLRQRRRPAALHPGPPRGDVGVRGRRVRQVLRTPRRLHGHLGTGCDPPAQRPLRRQARPRARRRDRRADRAQRDGRRLPAGGRPPGAVQGRGERVPRRGQRGAAAAQRARPRDPHRARPPRPHGRDHPERPAGASPTRAPEHAFKQVPSSPPNAFAATLSPRPGRGRAGRRDPQRRRSRRHPRRPGRPRCGGGGRAGRRRPRRGRGEGAARQGRAARRPAVRHGVDRPAGHPAQLRADARLRHAADRRIQLPVQPVPARVRQGAGGADRRRRRADRDALPHRAQHRRRRGRDVARAAPAAGAAAPTGRGGTTVEQNVADWWDHGRAAEHASTPTR